jgi:hypothetical protein
MSQRCYRLLDSDRQFIEEGTAPGSYRPHEKENDLREKVELLGPRFDRLFEDVKLLEQGSDRTTNYLDTDAGRNTWIELMGIEEPSSQEKLEQELAFHRGEPGSGPAAFGVKLGRTVNRLMRWPAFGNLDQDDIVADLVWGFLCGLHYDLRMAGNVTEDVLREDTTEILHRVEERADTYANTIPDPQAEVLARSRQRRAKRREMALRVHEALSEDCPTTRLEMQWGFTDWDDESESEDTPSRFCSMVVAHLIDDAVDGEYKFNSVKQDRAFWREYGPAEEFGVEGFVTEAKVHSVIEERRLLKKHDLLCQLERDAETLATKSSQGAWAEDILPKIVEEGPVSSTDIAQDIYNSNDYKASVTRLAKDLAGRERNKQREGVEVWTERPLLEGDRDGWKATEYGKAANQALQRYLAGQGSYAQPLQLMPFPDELLKDVFAEVTTAGEE